MPDLRNLSPTTQSQFGFVTGDQVKSAGITRYGLCHLLRSGVLESPRPGLYRTWGAPQTWEADVMAACLSGSPSPIASHRTALRLWGMRRDDDIEVTIRYPQRLVIGGVIVHRSRDLEPFDVMHVDGIPVTSPIRTLCDSGLAFPESEVGRLVDHAIATEVVSLAELWQFRHRVGRQGRNGAGVLDRVLDSLPSGLGAAESGPEVMLMRLCSGKGLPPVVPQYEVVVDGQRFRFDLAIPSTRVGIEFDGYDVHAERTQFVRDRRRQNALVLEGWTVLRFTWGDLKDRPEAVVAEIRRSVRRRNTP